MINLLDTIPSSQVMIPPIVNPSNIMETIGHTPLVGLNRISNAYPFQLYAKMESFNPGGSIKDRTAFTILRDALQQGKIKEGGIVIESSSGNMAIGLAQACLFFGLQLIVVVDPKLNKHTAKILEVYGATIETVTKPEKNGGFLKSRLNKVAELLKVYPNSYWTNQYGNTLNPKTHHTTMSEIAAALHGDVDYVFIATSTCGTLMGCAEYIARNGLSTKIIAVDAVGSVLFRKDKKERLIPGHGAGVPSNFLDIQAVHKVIHVSDEECIKGCWKLLKEEAILCGGSSGAIISAVEKMKGTIKPNSVSALILCDRGERYLDTIFNLDWLQLHFPTIEIPHTITAS
ncbi:2,3-diaminopropionate biosynthesis protein SbnA [Aquimarina sp. W85]|uniref:2,3-diaminopropionate biosynthesis protein SbnA n=1 Tax=Aquimarina rhodophyticola TaxID=3342246 RepID=UPI00366E1BEA